MSTIEEAREQARAALSEDGFFNREQSTIVRALLDATEPPKPAEDERETLDGAISRLSEYVNAGSIIHVASCYRTGDGKVHLIAFDDLREVLNAAAGYRKGPRPITDEMVEAAAGADFEFGKESMTWDAWVAHDSDHAGWLRKKARAALEAAEGARR